MKDLFGNELTPAEESRIAKDRRRPDRAHAAPPGSGPFSECCKTCAHYCRVEHHDKVYRKCELMQDHWTHGPGTDIRASDLACRFWQPQNDKAAQRQED